MTSRCLMFQRGGRVLVDTTRDQAGEAEDLLREFAELRSAAGHLHTYRVTDLSLWGAASSGHQADELLDMLDRHASMRVPMDLSVQITDFFSRYGRVRLTGAPGSLSLVSDDPLVLAEISRELEITADGASIPVPDSERGRVKALLARAGYPVRDDVEPVVPMTADYRLRPEVSLRDYQSSAVSRFIKGSPTGGLVLLPCGAGKTVVGVAIAAELRAWVLVVTPNRTIGDQWADHFLRMTDLTAGDIHLFDGVAGERPVTITTYQALTSEQGGVLARLTEAADIPWGLVIYDEVHSLPADVFRRSASLQSRRKLGLTATLVREDGRERETFALVGPPVWQSRWKDLERQGWISPVECIEVRVRARGESAAGRSDRGLLAKIQTAERILERHRDDRVLVAAHRLKEVHALARRLGAPAVTGKTPHAERAERYRAFQAGENRCLVVSRVANVGVDLPDASVLIQVSGTFGSRMEEAQRLGRLLRPKAGQKPARFYSLVLPDTREREYAARRQRFLIEQGYRYQVVNTRA